VPNTNKYKRGKDQQRPGLAVCGVFPSAKLVDIPLAKERRMAVPEL
jgi:hypothetical protein